MFAETYTIPFGKREKQIICKYQKIEQERENVMMGGWGEEARARHLHASFVPDARINGQSPDLGAPTY